MKPGDLVRHKDDTEVFFGSGTELDLGLGLVMELSEEDDYIRVQWGLDARAVLEWLPAGDVDLISRGEAK